MINELINEMVDAGVHYGHQTKKWNPRMKPFLMKDRGGIYIIDLEKTVQQLDKASDFLADIVRKGKKVLFVNDEDNLRISAQEVHITQDPTTKKQTVKGLGNVQLALSTEEQASLNKHFGKYAPASP